MKSKEAVDILSRNTNLGYGIIIEGDTKEIKEALSIGIKAIQTHCDIEWVKITPESIKNLKDHHYYLVADTRYETPMKAKYDEDYPQFTLLLRRNDTACASVCLLENDCTITHYMELPLLPW